MKATELSFQEFVDAIQTADDEAALQKVATRVTQRLCFRWFAYLSLGDHKAALISSYPKSWTTRYLARGYEQLDPVVLHAKRASRVFAWDGSVPIGSVDREQRHFFDEAATFGIKTGATVPILGGFGRVAAFTFATEERSAALDRLIAESADVLHLVGLYFHAHAMTKLDNMSEPCADHPLSQRERQCLAWAARGKTIAEIAVIIGISPRTVVFHIENARKKLGASSLTQCVAIAMKHGLLP
jgi:LuxR family transcriptional regulator, activator of conjugal transfer of Ti plasmids